MKAWKVYKIYCFVSEKHYIGITSKPLPVRLEEHFKAAKSGRTNKNGTLYALHAAIIKYGESSFSIEIIENDLELDVAREKESFYLEKYNAYGGGRHVAGLPRGYNQTCGGELPDYGEIQHAKTHYSVVKSLAASEKNIVTKAKKSSKDHTRNITTNKQYKAIAKPTSRDKSTASSWDEGEHITRCPSCRKEIVFRTGKNEYPSWEKVSCNDCKLLFMIVPKD